MSRAATRLGDEEDAFNAQLQLITEGKAPIPLLFEPYQDKISSQKEIIEATTVNTLKIISEDEDTAF